MLLSVLFGLQKHSTTGASACPFLVSDFILQLTFPKNPNFFQKGVDRALSIRYTDIVA